MPFSWDSRRRKWERPTETEPTAPKASCGPTRTASGSWVMWPASSGTCGRSSSLESSLSLITGFVAASRPASGLRVPRDWARAQGPDSDRRRELCWSWPSLLRWSRRSSWTASRTPRLEQKRLAVLGGEERRRQAAGLMSPSGSECLEGRVIH